MNKQFFWQIPINSRITESVAKSKSNPRGTKMTIEGTAISATTTRNNIKYLASELSKAAHTLQGKPLLKDHENKIDSIVGKVIKAEFAPVSDSIVFKAEIMDSVVQDKIQDGLINSLSVGGIVEDLEKDDDGSEIARGISFVELSLVAIGADPDAKFGMGKYIANSLSEAIMNENKVMEVNEMDENTIELIKELKERINKLEKEKPILDETKGHVGSTIEVDEKDVTSSDYVLENALDGPGLALYKKTSRGMRTRRESVYPWEK